MHCVEARRDAGRFLVLEGAQRTSWNAGIAGLDKAVRAALRVAAWACLLTGPACAVAQIGTAGMVPFSMDHRRGAVGHSPVDVSFLLDAPAGKHGFVQVKNGHLATGDGQRIRFWGVNITDWSPGSRQIPAKQDAAYWAATLARFGINCVRFQFLDLDTPRGLIKSGPTSQRLDPQALDREDFFIAELEKRGIYIDFNLLVGRPFKAGDEVQDASLLRQGAKGISLYDRRMIELQKQYAHELLTHTNPYTHIAYTNDPAVAIVEINNENAINVGFRAPSPFYAQELTSLYTAWLKEHRSPAQLAQLRTLAGVTMDTSIPLLQGLQKATAPPERFYAEAEFYTDLQRRYFVDMETYLKTTLALKSLVIATADHSHSNSGYPLLLAERSMDIIDGHDYWQHPEMYVRKSPMVNDPSDSTVVELSRSPLAGKPYTVSEVNDPFPNDYDGEGIPILAAYAGLQDWDAIMWYTFEPKIDRNWKPYVGDPFDLSLDPVKMPELAADALLFLRGDVQKARDTESRTYSEHQVFDSMLLPSTDRPYFTPGFPLQLPLEHEVRIASLNGPPTAPFPQMPASDPILSDTGQLAWYTSPQQRGMVSVETSRSEALIGFVRANDKQLDHLGASVQNDFCTILLSSLDAQPIAEASRLLLVAGGRVENTGQLWNSAGTDVTNWGGPPTLIDPVRGTLRLLALSGARAVQVQPLDGAGKPLGDALEARKLGDTWAFAVGAPITTWYEVTVER